MSQLTTALGLVQTGVCAVLTNDATLMALLAGDGVYDEVAENAAFPYIYLGEPVENVQDTFARRGRDVQFKPRIWSQYRGNKELYTIADRVIFLLDRQPFTISSGVVAYCLYAGAPTVIRDPDQVSRQMVLTFNLLIEE